MNTIENSLRTRLIRSLFGMVVGVSILFSIGVYLVVDQADDLLFDQHLESTIASFIAQYRQHPGIADLPRENFIVYAADRGLAGIPDDLRAMAPGDDELVRDGRLYDVQVRRVDGVRFYFLFDETVYEDYGNAVLAISAGTVLIIFLAAIGLGSWFVDRIVSPVTELANRLLRTGANDTAPLAMDPDADRDELYYLTTAVNRYNHRIGELLQREREFSSDVAHELRTPLMGIQGAAENLARRVERDDQSDALLDRVKRRSTQMATLIDGLLQLARDPHDLEQVVEEVDVGKVIEEQVSLLRDIALHRGIRVRVHPQQTPRVSAVRSAVSVTLGNLLKNAVTHTTTSNVDVYVSDDGVVIQDYGPGIDRAFQAAMFERNARGETGSPSGSGIGLSLVQRFCDLFRWDIQVHSELGTGTRISLRFG